MTWGCPSVLPRALSQILGNSLCYTPRHPPALDLRSTLKQRTELGSHGDSWFCHLGLCDPEQPPAALPERSHQQCSDTGKHSWFHPVGMPGAVVYFRVSGKACAHPAWSIWAEWHALAV